jgi:hypothetical protein
VKIIDRIGQRYERLIVLSRAPNKNERDTNARWNCRCDCGNLVIAYGQDLARGKFKSCGCLNAERIQSHGMSRTRIYNVWKQIFQRCENKDCPSYKNYGARGIGVCEEWRDFAVFYSEMGDCPVGYSLERRDNNLGYSKINCRWATSKEQHSNKRTNHFLELNGERHTVGNWSEKTGIEVSTLFARLGYGWSVERALTEPVKTRKSKSKDSS